MRRKSRNESFAVHPDDRADASLRAETFNLKEQHSNSTIDRNGQTFFRSAILDDLSRPGSSLSNDKSQTVPRREKSKAISPAKTLTRMETSTSRFASPKAFDMPLKTLDRKEKRKKTDGKSPSPSNTTSSSLSASSLKESTSILIDRLKSLKKETILLLISLGLQITSVLVSIITFKHLKYPDPGSVFACVLYIDGKVDSTSCFSIETTRTLYVIGISIGIFCGFLTLTAACLYEVGLKTTINHNGGKDQFIQRYSDRIDVNLVDMGKNAAWFTTITWMIYAGIEFYSSLSYLSGSEYEVFIEEYT